MRSKMIFQLLERALDECGNNLDAAIKGLHELSLKYAEGNSETAEESNSNMGKGMRFLVGQVGIFKALLFASFNVTQFCFMTSLF